MDYLSSLEMGDLVFVVYSNEEAKLRDCFCFLKSGFDNNEFLFIMIDSLPKDEIIKRIVKEWNFGNVKDFEGLKDDIIITTPKEWHYPDGDLNTCRILKKWDLAFSNASKRGKRGLRAFVDVTAFFIDGLENALIPYEEILEKQFYFPFLSVYAYKMDDIKKMTHQQYALLNTNHGIWIKNSRYHSYTLYADEGCFLSSTQFLVLPKTTLLSYVGDGLRGCFKKVFRYEYYCVHFGKCC